MHEIQIHIHMHIFNVEFALCIVVVLTLRTQYVWGPNCTLMCFRYFEEALDAWLIHEEGGDTMENY